MSFVARGPLKVLLQTAGGQYLALGAGLYVLFPEQVQRILTPFLVNYPQVANFAAGSSGNDRETHGRQQQPIIIQTPAPTVYHGGSSSKSTVTSVVTYAVVGAGVCWAGYMVIVTVLPDAVSQLLPVTKQCFEKTSKTLGRALLNVREVLEEKIMGVSKQQEELGKKQDETDAKVSSVSKDLGEARLDLAMLRDQLSRAQGSLDETQDMQGYTLRGVQLLVKCVTSFLPDDNDFFGDIAKFIQDGDKVDQQMKRSSSDCKMGSDNALPSTPIAHAVVRQMSTMSRVPSDENISVATAAASDDEAINEVHAIVAGTAV